MPNPKAMPKIFSDEDNRYRRPGRYKGGRYKYALRPDREIINITVDAQVRDALVALAYLRGNSGEYASMLRELLTDFARREVESLEPEDRRKFDDEILPAVIEVRTIKREQRRDDMDAWNACRSEREDVMPKPG